MNVIRKRDMERAQESIVNTLNPSKRIRDLEKRLKFSETFENRVALADALLEDGMVESAIGHYKAALKDMFKEDYYVLSKLQEAYFNLSDFENSLEIAEKIKGNQKFPKSRSNFIYGLTLEQKGQLQAAEEQLRRFDAPYNYYQQRLELARFLVRCENKADAKTIYQEIVDESENMSKQSLRANRAVFKLAKEELSVLV